MHIIAPHFTTATSFGTTPPRTSPLPPQHSPTHHQPWRTNAATSSTCKRPNNPTPTHRIPRTSYILPLRLLTPLLLSSYVPRKCSATNRIIQAKDHASVQISVGKVDESGRYTGDNQVFALCGFVRSMGESDDCVNRLAQREGFLKGVWSASR